MGNTYSCLHYHVVFSTKNRATFIKPDIEQRVWEYIGGIARHHKMTAIQVGGIDDHVHVLVNAPPTLAPFQIAQYLKGESSKWIHETFPQLQRFAWQEGYGAFTVSKSNISDVGERCIGGVLTPGGVGFASGPLPGRKYGSPQYQPFREPSPDSST